VESVPLQDGHGVFSIHVIILGQQNLGAAFWAGGGRSTGRTTLMDILVLFCTFAIASAIVLRRQVSSLVARAR
jgi:hypothetical protein